MPEIETIFKELEKLKKEVEAAKQERAEKKGQLSEKMNALQSFDVKSIAEAKKKTIQLQKEMGKLETEIVSGFEKLKESYEW